MKRKELWLKCPKCGTVAKYGGYPPEPQLSTVVCLTCGHAAPGGTLERVKPQPTPQELGG